MPQEEHSFGRVGRVLDNIGRLDRRPQDFFISHGNSTGWKIRVVEDVRAMRKDNETMDLGNRALEHDELLLLRAAIKQFER